MTIRYRNYSKKEKLSGRADQHALRIATGASIVIFAKFFHLDRIGKVHTYGERHLAGFHHESIPMVGIL